MKRFRRVLVGVDLDRETEAVTAGSRKAALQAHWLAEKTGATLTLFHSTHEARHFVGPQGRPELSEKELAALESLVSDYRSSGIDTELVTSDERPFLAIVRRALSGENDLVIVAKRNVPARRFGPLGSTSLKLVHNCPAPVWIVKPDHDLVHRLVIAATDLSPVGDLALEYAAWVAEASDAKLGVLHAWQLSMELQIDASRMSSDAVERERQEVPARARAHIESVLEPLGLSSAPRVEIHRDAPERLIRQAVEEGSPDLLVMGSISRGGIAGLLVGNTAERVLREVDCSLLVVKPENFVSPVEL